MNRDFHNSMANAKKFESLQLKPNILKGIIAMGYDNPNKVQDTLLPILCADPPSNIIMNTNLGENIIVPIVIAMLERIDSSQNYPQALCVSSTPQMAARIIEIGSKIAQYSSIEFGYIDSGVSHKRYPDEHIIVVAPEQLNRLISDKLCNFDNINGFLIINTDEMFTDETQRHCKIIADKLPTAIPNFGGPGFDGTPSKCQIVYLSPSVPESAQYIAKRAIFFDFFQVPGSMDKIIQFYVRCRDRDEKYQIIRNNYHLLSDPRSIIYCQNHETAIWLAENMKRDINRPFNIYVAFYTEEISVEERIKGLKSTKSVAYATVTTDALMPYLYVAYTPFVVNFDIPINQNGGADFDTYFSRISRIGRVGTGIVINLVDSEQSMETCSAIEKHFGKTIYSIDDEDLNEFEIIDINAKSADDVVVSFFQKIFCRQDPHMSLLSTKTFEELRLTRDFFKERKSKPSKFLEATATALYDNPERNLIAQGEAGTGKTTAMFLVTINRIDEMKKYPQVLCLVPTIELCTQISRRAHAAASEARIWWFRAEDYSKFGFDFKRHVIIGTPKDLIDMMNGNAFDMDKIDLLVIDDADHIISTPNLWNDCKSITEKLSPKCQIMLFSTAYSVPTMEKALNFVKDPIVISLPRESELPQNILQYYVTYRNEEEKYQATLKLFNAICIFQGIIFCNTKETAIRLEKRLKEDGRPYRDVILVISDDISDKERLLEFWGWHWNVIIASTSLHDIFFYRNVIIVNFDMPIDQFGEVEYGIYLQRISRTARFGTSGVVVNMINETDDHEVVACRAIKQHFGKKLHYLNL